MNAFKRCIARVLVVCTIGLGMPSSSMAGIVPTDQVYASVRRDQVKDFLDRAEVRAKMQALGVDPDAARARVDALGDDEVATLTGEIDRLPAGGTDALTVVLVVFIILLITDILGVTKVFPFVKPMK